MRPEAATRSDILYLFGQQILILSGESRRILKTDACGNHAIAIFSNLRTRLRIGFSAVLHCRRS